MIHTDQTIYKSREIISPYIICQHSLCTIQMKWEAVCSEDTLIENSLFFGFCWCLYCPSWSLNSSSPWHFTTAWRIVSWIILLVEIQMSNMKMILMTAAKFKNSGMTLHDMEKTIILHLTLNTIKQNHSIGDCVLRVNCINHCGVSKNEVQQESGQVFEREISKLTLSHWEVAHTR